MMKIILFMAAMMMVNSVGNAGDPYDFYPSRVFRMDNAVFTRAESLIEITPTRPLLIKDKEGNITLASSDGKVMVQVDVLGNQTFSIGGRREYSRGASGEVEKRWSRESGSSLVRIENEHSEITGFEEYGLGGKLLASYDELGNLVRSIEYDKYGKRALYAVDELTLTRTVYDNNGLAVKDIDFEGSEIAFYSYDADLKLISRENAIGDVTYYDSFGQMSKTYDRYGKLIQTYNYRHSPIEEGKRELVSVKDEITKSITTYIDGRQQKTVDFEGKTIAEYKWAGSRLIYAEDLVTDEITWYNNGRPTYTTYRGEISREWFYDQGRLAGIWRESDNSIEVYSHGRLAMRAQCVRKLTLEELVAFRRLYGVNEG